MKQYQQIQGELMIQEVMAGAVDDKIEAIVSKDSMGIINIITEIASYHQLIKERESLLTRLEYLKGMFEAYNEILLQLKEEQEE